MWKYGNMEMALTLKDLTQSKSLFTYHFHISTFALRFHIFTFVLPFSYFHICRVFSHLHFDLQSNNTISQSLLWRFSSFFTSLLLNLLVARTFGPVASGEVNYFVAIASLLVLLSSFNLDAAIIHFTAAGKIKLNKLLTLSLLVVLVSAVLYFAFSFYWNGTTQSLGTMHDFPVYAGLYLLGLQVHAMTIAIYYGKQDFFMPGLIISILNLVQIIMLLFVFNNPGEQALIDYMRVFFLVPFIQAIFLWIWLQANKKLDFRLAMPLRGEWKAISRFSLVIFITNIILFLVYRIDYWMLVKLDHSDLNAEKLGNYIQATRIGQILLVFSSAIGAGVFSTTSAMIDQTPKITGNLCRIMRLLLAGGLIFYLVYLVTGRYLIPLLYGEGFSYIYVCGLILFPGIIALMTVSVTANYLSGINQAKFNLKGVILTLVIIVAGNYLFIPRYGIYAASLVSTIGYLGYAFFMLRHFKNQTACAWSDMLLAKKSDRPSIASLQALLRSKNDIR